MTITITNLTPHPVTIHRTRPADTGAPADRAPYVRSHRRAHLVRGGG